MLDELKELNPSKETINNFAVSFANQIFNSTEIKAFTFSALICSGVSGCAINISRKFINFML